MSFDSTIVIHTAEFVTISNTATEHLRRATSSSGLDRMDLVIKQTLSEKDRRNRVLIQGLSQYLMTDGVVHPYRVNLTFDVPALNQVKASNASAVLGESVAAIWFMRFAHILGMPIVGAPATTDVHIAALLRGES